MQKKKTFDKIQHPLVIKNLEKLDRHLPQHIKAKYSKLLVNIILNGEKQKALFLKSKRKQSYSLSPLFFNTVLEFLTKAIRQEKA
jgi:hypothetical protein